MHYLIFGSSVTLFELSAMGIAGRPFTVACIKFSNFGGSGNHHGGPMARCGETETFLQDAGRGAHTGEVSIISSPRATAGVRMSIDLELGPLFGLNAVGVDATQVHPLRHLAARALGAPWVLDGRSMGWRAVRRTIPAWLASAK